MCKTLKLHCEDRVILTSYELNMKIYKLNCNFNLYICFSGQAPYAAIARRMIIDAQRMRIE